MYKSLVHNNQGPDSYAFIGFIGFIGPDDINYSTLAKFMKTILLPTEMVFKTVN